MGLAERRGRERGEQQSCGVRWCFSHCLPAVLTPRPPTLTFLIGLTDGPDFCIGPSSEDFYESLFICASSLQGQDQEDLTTALTPCRDSRGPGQEGLCLSNHPGGKCSDHQAFLDFLFTPRPETAQSGQNMPTCQDFQNLP